MTRHRFDPLSFIFGLLFAGVAVLALIGVEVVSWRDLAWIAPSLLVIAGAALLLSSAGRSRGDDAAIEPVFPPDDATGSDVLRDDGGEVPVAAPAEATDDVSRASDAPEMGHTSEER